MESEKMGWIGWREKKDGLAGEKKMKWMDGIAGKKIGNEKHGMDWLARKKGWIGWRDSLTREKSLWVPPLDGSNQQHPTNPTL